MEKKPNSTRKLVNVSEVERKSASSELNELQSKKTLTEKDRKRINYLKSQTISGDMIHD